MAKSRNPLKVLAEHCLLRFSCQRPGWSVRWTRSAYNKPKSFHSRNCDLPLRRILQKKACASVERPCFLHQHNQQAYCFSAVELRHLRYFVAVAEMENVSRAALKLHVSQPGLSRQIRDLESELGFPLFERSAKSVRLTEAGRAFLVESRAVLQRAEDAVQAARDIATGG